MNRISTRCSRTPVNRYGWCRRSLSGNRARTEIETTGQPTFRRRTSSSATIVAAKPNTGSTATSRSLTTAGQANRSGSVRSAVHVAMGRADQRSVRLNQHSDSLISMLVNTRTQSRSFPRLEGVSLRRKSARRFEWIHAVHQDTDCIARAPISTASRLPSKPATTTSSTNSSACKDSHQYWVEYALEQWNTVQQIATPTRDAPGGGQPQLLPRAPRGDP